MTVRRVARRAPPRRSPQPRARRIKTPQRLDSTLLDNGTAVILCPRPQLAQAYIAVFFGVGSRHETAAENGITHVLEHMLFRGTKSYKNATALNAAAEDLGGFLEGATYRDHLMFATGCHPSALPTATRILGELVTTPRYGFMEIERSILREEVLEGLDATGRSIDIDNIAHEKIFPAHGLGMPIEGSLDNLARVQVADLERYRRRFLVGTNAVVCAAGPMDVSATRDAIAAAFAPLAAGTPALSAAPPEPAGAPSFTYVRDASSQVDVRLTFRGLAVQDPQHPALVVLGRLLADGLASRMHAELVDRQGLAYALHAGPTTYADCGLFEFDVAVAPAKAADVVQAILNFAKGASRLRFTDAELDRVRRRYGYGTAFMADSAIDLASWYGRSTLFAVENEMEHLGAAMALVDAAAVRQVARRVFQPESLVVTAVGELKRSEVKKLRDVVMTARF